MIALQCPLRGAFTVTRGSARALKTKHRFDYVPRSLQQDANNDGDGKSVTGTIYSETTGDHPIVSLYTKEGCTLCDKAVDVLKSVRDDQPHTLKAVDITDDDKEIFWDKYKWDIPVLHINGLYWTKHRLESEDAKKALEAARTGNFEIQKGEPDAGAMERRQEERKSQSESR